MGANGPRPTSVNGAKSIAVNTFSSTKSVCSLFLSTTFFLSYRSHKEMLLCSFTHIMLRMKEHTMDIWSININVKTNVNISNIFGFIHLANFMNFSSVVKKTIRRRSLSFYQIKIHIVI